MKRIITVLTLLSLLLLSGCVTVTDTEAEIGFFDEALLAECRLTGMPMPKSEDIRHGENTVYCNMTDEERVGYADEIAAYLIAKEDIYYKGYHYETGTVGGIFYLPEYRFAPLTEDTEHGGSFAFSLTEKLNEGNEFNFAYANGITVSVGIRDGKIGSYSYNTVIRINTNPMFIVYQPSDELRVVNDILRNQAGCEWLNEITSEDIAEVKIIKGAVGVAPGSLKEVQSSVDEAVIKRIFEAYYFGEIIPISRQDGEIDGGSGITVKFILMDGTIKELYFNNGHYRDINGNYFDLYIPKFEESDKVTKLYGFITHNNTGSAYYASEYAPGESEPFAEVDGVGDMEFIRIDRKPDSLPESPLYYIETDFGMLEIYGAYNFAFDGVHYLRVDGGTFYEMVGV